jgi:hypothetical protein
MTPRLPRDTSLTCPGCGWSGKKTTPGRAAYALSRHSCIRRHAKDAARARGAARAAAVDRTPKPCHHKRADHEHGTRACYTLDKCRCPPCARAVSTYETDRIKSHAYGRWGNYVDAGPSRAHIAALTNAGMGLKRIVAVSQVSQGVLWRLMYGKRHPDGTRTPSARVTATNQARILAISLDLADGARIDSTGTTRRIQALVTLGWSQAKIAHQLGILPSNLTPLVHGRRPVVTAATSRAVAALYDGWSMQLPPETNQRERIAASRARRYAKQRRWAPPLAWDDEAIDNPAARPDRGHRSRPIDRVDQAVIDRILAGERLHATKAERIAVTAAWQAAGRSLNQLEQLPGWKADRYTSSPPEQLDGAA